MRSVDRGECERFGHFTDPSGRERELIAHPGPGASTLVIDRLAGVIGDERLVARIASDEPQENARLMASLYLADERGRHCRRLTLEDLGVGSSVGAVATPDLTQQSVALSGGELIDEHGFSYRLQRTDSGGSVSEIRWWLTPPSERDARPRPVTVREAIGSLQSYEPVRRLTSEILARHDGDRSVSTCLLRAELERLHESSTVLNRGLREAVLVAVNERGLTMSQIAIRCGRVKRDRRGGESGETSWLARRVGLLPEGGKDAPTPWVSSDVLALIARDGLGVCPREVELG